MNTTSFKIKLLTLIGFIIAGVTPIKAQTDEYVSLEPLTGVTRTKLKTKVSWPSQTTNHKIEFAYGQPKDVKTSEYYDLLAFDSDPVAISTPARGTVYKFEKQSGKEYYESPIDLPTGSCSAIRATVTLTKDSYVEFEWAVDSEEQGGTFYFSEYEYDFVSIPQNPYLEISGYKTFEKQRVYLSAGEHKLEWQFHKASANSGLGIARIRNISFHDTYDLEWHEIAADMDGNIELNNLAPNKHFSIRATATDSNGESVYSNFLSGKTLPITLTNPRSSISQTTATISYDMDAGEAPIRKGFIEYSGFGDETFVRYDVKWDGWESEVDKTGDPLSITFTTDATVNVTMYVSVKGHTRYNYGRDAIYSSLTIGEPFNTSVSSRAESTESLKYTFGPGTHTIEITPDKHGDYSPYEGKVLLYFSDPYPNYLYNDLTKVKSRDTTIYCEGEMTHSFTNLNPASSHTYIPFIELDYTPLFMEDQTGLDLRMDYAFKINTLNGSATVPEVLASEWTTADIMTSVEAGDGNIESVWLEYRKAGTQTYSRIELEKTAGEQTAHLTRLSPGSEYQIRTGGILSNCEEPFVSDEVSFQTKPVEITDVEVHDINCASAILTGTLSCGDVEIYNSGYQIFNQSEQTADIENGTLNVKLENLNPSQKCKVRLFVQPYGGEKVYSEWVEFMPKAIEFGEITAKSLEEDGLHIGVNIDMGDLIPTKVVMSRTYAGEVDPVRQDGGNYEFVINDYIVNQSHRVTITVYKDNHQWSSWAYLRAVEIGEPEFNIGTTTADGVIPIVRSTVDSSRFNVLLSEYEKDTRPIDFSIDESGIRVSLKDLAPAAAFTIHLYYDDTEIYNTTHQTQRPLVTYRAVSTETSITISDIKCLSEDFMQDYNVILNGHSSEIPYGSSRIATFRDLEPDTEYNLLIQSRYDNNQYVSYSGVTPVKTSTISIPQPYESEIHQTGIVFKTKAPVSKEGAIAETGMRVQFGSQSYYIPAENGSETIVVSGLRPNEEYIAMPYYKSVNGNYHTPNYKIYKTSALRFMNTETSKISNRSATLSTEIACDLLSNPNIGYQWKGMHWQSDPVSTEAKVTPEGDKMVLAFKPGMLEPNCDYAYRAYISYTLMNGGKYEVYNVSQSGPSHWYNFRTELEYVFFETEPMTMVRTDRATNSIVFCGYLSYGSENVEKCGYEYWKIRDLDNSSAHVQSDVTRVETDENMEYSIPLTEISGIFEVRAFAETESGIYLGNTVRFSTGEDSGVYEIMDNVTPLIEPINEGIRISNAQNQKYFIYGIDGRLIQTGLLTSTLQTIKGLPGNSIYIVCLSSGVRAKVMIR